MQTYYIDTRPGAPGTFAPPATVLDDADYQRWLTALYQQSELRDGDRTLYFGASQKINEMSVHTQRGSRVMTVGPFAIAAAYALHELSGGHIAAEAIA